MGDGPDKTPPYSCHDDPTPTPPTPPPPAPTDAPNCTQAGQDDLCKIACESTCRSFPPGFKAAGCADQKYCTNPPAWAKGSVCTCPSELVSELEAAPSDSCTKDSDCPGS